MTEKTSGKQTGSLRLYKGADQAERFLSSLAQCRELDLSVERVTDTTLTLRLPYGEHIVGNPDTGVIHGGAITTLLDTACGTVVLLALEQFEICPTLDLRVDYMGPAEPGKPVFGTAQPVRITRNILFTKAVAHQGDPERPVATCMATFMRIGSEATPAAFRDFGEGKAGAVWEGRA